jgi:hypothetical protein
MKHTDRQHMKLLINADQTKTNYYQTNHFQKETNVLLS